MINIRKNLIAICLMLGCIGMLYGCASSKEDKDVDESTKYSYEAYRGTTKHNMREDETTSIKPVEGPTASVEPNDDIIEITTEDKSSEKETKPTTIKPADTTNSENTSQETTTSEETTPEEETTVAEGETDESGTNGTEDEATGSEGETTAPDEIMEPFYMSKSEFDIEEMSYTRLQSYIKNNPGNIVWTSMDASIAQIVNDELIGIYAGSTTITGTSGDVTVEITVNVAGEDMGDEGGLEEEEKIRTFLSSERIYLFMDTTSQLEVDIMDKLENILDEIETVTGYSYTDVSEQVEYSDTRNKIVIKVIGSAYEDIYASTDEVVLSTDNPALELYGTNVLVHGLLHVIQYRNGMDVGNTLTEGYAEYLQEKVCERLSYNTGYDAYATQLSALKQLEKITESNMESMLLYPDNPYPLSYFFVKHIVGTYGDEKLKQLVDAITEKAIEMHGEVIAGQSSLFTEEEILAIIEANTTDSLMTSFLAYCTELTANNS